MLKNYYQNYQKILQPQLNKNIKKKFKSNSIIINGVAIFFFTLSYYFYYLSLEKCLKGEGECSLKWNWILKKVIQLIISILIIIILILLIIYNIISKLHLIHFIITFFLFYEYSHSTYFHDHGGLNIIGLFFALFLLFIIMLLIKIFLFIFGVKYKYKVFFSLFLLIYYNIIIVPLNCDDWAKGLNNTYIENDANKYGCQIQFPKICPYKLIGFTQDFSKISGKNCLNKKENARINILSHSKSPYINQKTLKFGFPLTNNDEGRKDENQNIIILRNYTFHNLIDMDNYFPHELNKPEYIVDFSKDPFGELIIDLHYNETLSKERKKFENTSIPYSDNILILYIDSVSRATAMRKLKKTLSFFEKFISYQGENNGKNKKEKFHSFQFFKYHSFEGYTYINFPILFYGNKPKGKNMKRITKYLKETGYVTGYSSDLCLKDNSRTYHNLTNAELYDHQLTLCDPNTPSINSVIKRCLYGKIKQYYLYDYINQFWRKYQNNRKFATIVINDGHEGTLEAIKYSDNIIYNFLISLYNDNLLKDSTLFLLSDHGCGMPSIYYLNDFFQIERRLPMLFMIVNDRKNKDYNQQYYNIKENQQTFITGFDIYNTICNIIYGDNYTNIPNKKEFYDTPKSPLGQSLFEKIDAKNRKPKNYEGMITNICK